MFVCMWMICTTFIEYPGKEAVAPVDPEAESTPHTEKVVTGTNEASMNETFSSKVRGAIAGVSCVLMLFTCYYRIVGNFRGVQFSQFSRISCYLQKFDQRWISTIVQCTMGMIVCSHENFEDWPSVKVRPHENFPLCGMYMYNVVMYFVYQYYQGLVGTTVFSSIMPCTCEGLEFMTVIIILSDFVIVVTNYVCHMCSTKSVLGSTCTCIHP